MICRGVSILPGNKLWWKKYKTTLLCESLVIFCFPNNNKHLKIDPQKLILYFLAFAFTFGISLTECIKYWCVFDSIFLRGRFLWKILIANTLASKFENLRKEKGFKNYVEVETSSIPEPEFARIKTNWGLFRVWVSTTHFREGEGITPEWLDKSFLRTRFYPFPPALVFPRTIRYIFIPS